MADDGQGEKGRNVKGVRSSWAADQRRRQKEMILKQKASRNERVNLARKLGEQVADELGDEISEMFANTESDSGKTSAEKKRSNKSRSSASNRADVVDEDLETSQTDSPGSTGRRRGKGRKDAKSDDELYRGQLMMPDWMVAVPERLTESWLVAARPQVT
jgi:hypothetical protein